MCNMLDAMAGGKLTGDPVLNDLGQNQVVANATLVVERRGKTPQFVQLAVWGKRSRTFMLKCTKGSRLIVRGQIELREVESGKHYLNCDVSEFHVL
jgi:single-stranded DNA-binding protein